MSPKFPKLFVFVLVGALILSACNNPMAAKPGVWYNPLSWGDKTASQTAEEILANAQAEKTVRDAQAAATAMAGGTVPTVVVVVESTPMVVNPTAQVSIQSNQVTDFYGQACYLPEGSVIVGPEKDWKVTIVMLDGRIYQPCLPEEKVRPAFESSFTGQMTAEFTFHGINASLWQDTNKDGIPDKELAGKVGSKVVRIEAGAWYKVIHGDHNGGFDLVPLAK